MFQGEIREALQEEVGAGPSAEGKAVMSPEDKQMRTRPASQQGCVWQVRTAQGPVRID